MKRINKLWAAVALALILCLAAPVALPAGALPGISAQAASKVKLNKTKATLYLGQTLQLKLKNAKGKVTWKTSNKNKATVSGNGKVTAKKTGSVTITAVNNKKKYTCKITVKSGLSADSKKLALTGTGAATVNVVQKVDGLVSIKNSNPNVVTAAWAGAQGVGTNPLNVSAVGAGSSTLTLTNTATKDSLKIKVTVTNQTLKLGNETDTNLYIPVHQPFTPRKTVRVYLYANSGSEDRMLTADIADDSIVECSWDYYGWLGDDYRLLYFSGQKPGTTTVKITNSMNAETITINVTVTG